MILLKKELSRGLNHVCADLQRLQGNESLPAPLLFSPPYESLSRTYVVTNMHSLLQTTGFSQDPGKGERLPRVLWAPLVMT